MTEKTKTPELGYSESFLANGDSRPFSRITIELEAINPDGSHEEPRVIPVNSWVKAVSAMFEADMAGITVASVLDVQDVSRTILHTNSTSSDDRFEASSDNNGDRGIQVGTGTQAVDKDDNKLQTKILHSASGESGKLRHQAQITKDVVAITNGYRVTTSRRFDNESGATITINEVGLVLRHNITGSTGAYEQFLVLRDIIPSGHAVVNFGSVIVRYHIDFVI